MIAACSPYVNLLATIHIQTHQQIQRGFLERPTGNKNHHGFEFHGFAHEVAAVSSERPDLSGIVILQLLQKRSL